jgi:hypothetical protein
LAFILLGIRFVYLGSAQSATAELFDRHIPLGLVGKLSIGFGALGLMLLVRWVIRTFRDPSSLRDEC